MPTATQSGYDRRAGRTGSKSANIEWFTDQFMRQMNMTMRQRMMVAVQYLQTRIVENISRPVTKTVSKRTGRIVSSNRSVPGEFPKADTTHLKNTVFRHTEERGNIISGYVGTPLDYGLFLELRMDRSFLARTLREEIDTIRAMLTETMR